MLGCLRVASFLRSRSKLRYNIRPHRLRTGSLVRDRFNPVPDGRAAVGTGRMFQDAFVVVNEQTRRDKNLRQALLHLIEFDRAADGVGSAAAKLTLIINRRTLPTQIDWRRSGAEHCPRRG